MEKQLNAIANLKKLKRKIVVFLRRSPNGSCRGSETAVPPTRYSGLA
ncbi:hypothetical protein [Dapis sp. BLCC M229]